MNSTTQRYSFIAGLVASLIVSACEDEPPTGLPDTVAVPARTAVQTARPAAAINPRVLRRFRAVADNKATVDRPPQRIELGRMLWYERRLSQANDISCNSCHDLSNFGVDGQRVSTGHQDQLGTRNAPTVYNAANHFALFWDGRAATAEEQATGPMLNPAEMAMTEAEVIARLNAIPEYRRRFAESFPDDAQPVTLDNVGRAIGAFERGLVTHSRWDDYLEGDTAALADDEIDGLRIFINVGCLACHTGPEVGATMFQRVGVFEPWPNRADTGRGAITGLTADEMMFKVPTLKNIAETAPYFHDGSAETLDEAIRLMARHQIGEEFDDAQVAAVVAFFGVFTGALPLSYIQEPALPSRQG